MYDKFDVEKIVLIGMLIVSVSQLLLAFFTTAVPIFITMGFYGLGFALMFPSMTTLIVTKAPEEHRGKAFGIFYACFSLGVILGSFTIGLLKGIPWLGFTTSAIVVLIVASIMYIRKRREIAA
jgi:MFS family permease